MVVTVIYRSNNVSFAYMDARLTMNLTADTYVLKSYVIFLCLAMPLNFYTCSFWALFKGRTLLSIGIPSWIAKLYYLGSRWGGHCLLKKSFVPNLVKGTNLVVVLSFTLARVSREILRHNHTLGLGVLDKNSSNFS